MTATAEMPKIWQPEQVQFALSRASNPELRRIIVEQTEEAVILYGKVSCFYMKQMAQEVVRHCAEERLIINRIIVSKK